jgi:photosystem II stability/assembly factor-like uncharacterized protein
MSWLTPRTAYVVGAGTCSPKPCSDVVTTTDGGTTWSLAGSLPVQIASQGNPKPLGVTEVRFASSDVGWAFTPLLVQTTDGGQTWSREPIPGHGKQVLSLSANSDGAYAVVSHCPWAEAPCGKSLSLWHTSTEAGAAWTRIPLELPDSVTADVAAYGDTVYVLDPLAGDGGTDLLYASTDGQTFAGRPIPCNNANNVGLIQVVATSATDVALLCDAPIGFGNAFKKVYVSHDTGLTDRSRGQLGMNGIQAQLAESRTGKLAVASYSDGSFIYVNDDHSKTWTMPVGIGDGGRGWNDIVYTTGKVAWVVYSPAGLFNGDGVLYVTHDAGLTWSPVFFD